jgi:hypothetical protein
MTAVVQLTALDDRGREIIAELEERTQERPREISKDGTREYYLSAHLVGVDGFDSMLDRIDSEWRDHLTRTT